MPINPPASLPGLVPTPAPIPVVKTPIQAPIPAAISIPIARTVAATMPKSNPISITSPTPAPIQMPISTPSAVPVTQFQPMMQQPVKAPAPFPQTPVTMTAESYKQELAKISGDIDSINALKATLKAQLSDLDDQLAQTQTTLSEIKKLSFDILNKEDEKQAAQALETMKQSLASIQQVQKTVETTTIQEFNTTVQKIRQLMTSVQTQLQVLESKSNVLKTTPSPSITPASTPATATPFGAPLSTQPPTQPPVTAAPAPIAKVEEKTTPERSLVHQFFNTTADIITGSIIMIVSVIKSIKEMIMPAQPTITELERQKEFEDAKKKVASNLTTPKIVTPTPVTTFNVAQTVVAPQAPLGSSAFENEVKANIATIEQVVKKLDEQRFSIKQMVGDIKKQSKNLRKRVEQNADFEKNASSKLSFDEERQADVWKKKAGDGFETLLNWIDTVFTTVKNSIVTLYDAMHQGISKGWKAISKERTPSGASRGK